jgi:DNA polymerase (family 10)
LEQANSGRRSAAHGTATIEAMPRRVARTDPPPEAASAEISREQSDHVDDADTRADEETTEPGALTNGAVARIFHDIGDILEVKGELVFKTVAYHRAADAIGRAPFSVTEAYRSGESPRIPGVGQAISDKLAELARTGRLDYYERLRAEIPASLIELLRIPGLGPRTVRLAYEELGIETLEDLRQAAEAGTLKNLRGVSAKTEQMILQGIAALESRPKRLLLPQAEATIDGLIAALEGTRGVHRIVPAGSFRRKRETIGDLDLLAETSDPAALIERFTGLGVVDKVIQQGGYKAAVTLLRGPQVDLMIMPPGEAGTYLIHFTGSKEHNVALRARTRDRGWSLSEKGYLRIDETGDPLTGAAAELRTFGTEEEAYAFLDLPFIEPELREGHGEIAAALAGRLPRLITQADLRGDLHTHSEWSDGVHTIEQMAEACRRRGYSYQVLTDHSISLAIARGLSPERVAEQAEIIRALNARFADEEAAGTAPPETPPGGFRLLHGCELEIRADGELDYPDELLATFDVVVASLHVSRRQSREELTRRTLNAIHSPHVDVIAHPAGRYIQVRDDLDLEWDEVYRAAARTGTVLEMNGSPHRLDLSVERARRALEQGCVLSVDSDAHKIAELDYVRWGITQARRAWVEPANVLNTRSLAELLAWVGAKADRVAAAAR